MATVNLRNVMKLISELKAINSIYPTGWIIKGYNIIPTKWDSIVALIETFGVSDLPYWIGTFDFPLFERIKERSKDFSVIFGILNDILRN